MMHPKIAVACALGSLVVACLNPEPALAARARDINACSLLDVSAISKVVGFRVHDGVRVDSGFESDGSYSSTCVWVIERQAAAILDPRAPLGGKSFIILNVVRWPKGSKLAGTFLEAFQEAALSGEIPGKPSAREFGDDALWWGDGLAVRRNNVSFGVSVVMPGIAPHHPGAFEELLAPLILERVDEELTGTSES